MGTSIAPLQASGMDVSAAALRYWEQRQNIVSGNLANVSTDGFKGERAFASLLNGSASPVVSTTTDFSAGPMMTTGAPLDLAIQGRDSSSSRPRTAIASRAVVPCRSTRNTNWSTGRVTRCSEKPTQPAAPPDRSPFRRERRRSRSTPAAPSLPTASRSPGFASNSPLRDRSSSTIRTASSFARHPSQTFPSASARCDRA